MKKEYTHNLNNIELKDFLSKSNTLILQNINNKKQLFTNIANFCSSEIKLTQKEITNILTEKEKSENSGIGNGIAIPNIQDESIQSISSMFIKLLKPIKYESIDKEPVDLIFMLITPNCIKSSHLKILALISRKLSNTKIRRNIRGTLDTESIYSILTM